MLSLSVHALDEKRWCISGITPTLAYCLYDLPEILQLRDRPDIRPRFFPDLVASDEAVNADWHEYNDPDLRHLFNSAGEVVTRDLTALHDEQLIFAAEHLSAWMTALNQARLILGECHHVAETDMERTALDAEKPRDKALLQIHLLGYLLQLFVEATTAEGAA